MQVEDATTSGSRRCTWAAAPLYDIGIYCINAARYLFRDEPMEVFAVQRAATDEPRFRDVDEMTSAILRFPGDRLATFTAASARPTSRRTRGRHRGDLRVEPAYEYAEAAAPARHDRRQDPRARRSRKRDQFAPELLYFSDCILEDREPEPSGWRGWPTCASSAPSTSSARAARPCGCRRSRAAAAVADQEIEQAAGATNRTEIHARGPSER